MPGRLRQLVPIALSLPLAVLLAGCGSGFVAIFAGDDNPSGAQPPSLVTKLAGAAPLLPPVNMIMEVVAQNYELPSALSRVAVELRAFGSVVDRQLILRVPNSTTIEFIYLTGAIQAEARNRWGDNALAENDVPAELVVRVDGESIADPVPLLLLRQPRAELQSLNERQAISPRGAVVSAAIQPVRLQLPKNLQPGTREFTEEVVSVNDLLVKVAFGRDLSSEFSAAITEILPTSSPERFELQIQMPAVDDPVQAHFLIESFPSGRSSLVSRVFYRPEVFGASPATGATEGGTIVVLYGQALVPADASGAPDFSRIEILVEKGGRGTPVAANQLRQDVSNRNRLVFAMPASPDGRPGPADLRLRVALESLFDTQSIVEVESYANAVFTYGDSYPYFSTRGATMRDAPTIIRLDPFLSSGSKVQDALSVVTGPAGLPFVSILAARGNGLFTRFGQPVRAATTSDGFQRYPVDFCVADFVGDGTRAGVLINRGLAGYARHTMVLGSTKTNPPLRFYEELAIDLEEEGLTCAAGDLNEDGTSDLVVVSKPLSPGGGSTPVVFLSETSGPDSPRFRRNAFSTYSGTFAFDAVDVSDVDADGDLDLVFANGGLEPRVLVAFGRGDGTFRTTDIVDLQGNTLPLKAAGYGVHTDSRIVGLHVIGPQNARSIAFAMSGVAQGAAAAALVHLRPGTKPRTFELIKSSDLLPFSAAEGLISRTCAGDLDGDGSPEIITAAVGALVEPIQMFERTSASVLTRAGGAVPPSIEPMGRVHGLAVGFAADKGTHNQPDGRRALFVSHETATETVTEQRISTYLVDTGVPNLRLLGPDAAQSVPTPVQAITLGRFWPKSGQTASQQSVDAWLVTSDRLRGMRNGGLGELVLESASLVADKILPQTLTTIRVGPTADDKAVARPAFLTSDGRIGLVVPGSPSVVEYLGGSTPVDLRGLAATKLRTRTVQDYSRITVGDVDADGIYDLVVSLALPASSGQGGEGECLLVFLKGQSEATSSFPFTAPDAKYAAASTTHGNASSMALGDLATSSENGYLELAVAIPVGGVLGNEVRFFRLDGSKGTFVRSFASKNHDALPVGNQPSLVLAADFNNDGATDLAVATRQDHNLWVFYNFPASGSTVDVDVTRLLGAPANPMSLPTSIPISMHESDLNGDGVPDIVLLLDSGTPTPDRQVAYFLAPGSLGGSGIRLVSHRSTGNYVPASGSWVPRGVAGSLAVGDLNGDRAVDLVIGWQSAGTRDQNVRVLFGNNF